jgi:hypothetical protein
MWFLIVLLFSSLSFAQNQPLPSEGQQTPLPSQVQSTRAGIFEFEFDPDDGAMIARVSDAGGTKPLEVEAVQLELIGDSGNRVRANLTRAQQSVFRGTVNLAQGEWNMVVRVKTAQTELEGQYSLGVGKAVTDGRFPLTPPNPEVGRLSWLVGVLLGVPLGLGLLVGIVALLQNALGGAKKASS